MEWVGKRFKVEKLVKKLLWELGFSIFGVAYGSYFRRRKMLVGEVMIFVEMVNEGWVRENLKVFGFSKLEKDDVLGEKGK